MLSALVFDGWRKGLIVTAILIGNGSNVIAVLNPAQDD
jgi:hypothetical protein